MRYLWPNGATVLPFPLRPEAPKDGAPAPLEVDASPDLYAEAPSGRMPRENDLGPEPSLWRNAAVSAVMLGASGIGLMAGASLVHADSLPTVDRPPDAELPPTLGARVAALEESRASMSEDELSRARNELWRAFATLEVEPLELELAARVSLSRGVGPGQSNRADDVRAVQSRLAELGFSVPTHGRFDRATERTLRVFEALVTGREGISGTTARVQPGSDLLLALNAPDAPRWQRVPASGPGFVNDDVDGFSYAADTLVDVVRDVGQRYSDSYLSVNPGAARISLNDASRREGGPNRDHSTHEVGLDLDVRLPKKDGSSGSNVLWRDYDREAAYAMIEAFASDARVEQILCSDRTLLRRIAESDVPWKHKVVYGGASHRNHLHIDISPPSVTLRAVG